jgi:brefeldin A-inhibited guanine nucleotide-exchange protein
LAAVRTLLEVAYLEGNSLHENWKDVVKGISQLEKLQIIGNENLNDPSSAGVNARRVSVDTKNLKQRGSKTPAFLEEVAAEASSQSMTIAVDRIFTASKNLSGQAIVEFVRYLCETSWEEISTSAEGEHPRMYCLQRLIEISFYNMNRIRVEWVNIWMILGEHFNRVGCQANANAGYFALDKLRQLSYNFLDLEELPNFKFQKEFLKPFEETLAKNPDVKIKDMVLACVQQLVQAKSARLKSGWKTIFATLIKAAKEKYGNCFSLVVLNLFGLN